MDIDFTNPFSSYWSDQVIWTNLLVLLNIVGALALGLVVGYERSYHSRAAGMRTYGFVCMASAALTIIAAYPHAWFGGHASLNAPIDPTRVVQGVVTGIGFLGAGVIMKEGFSISGLTTAASIWTSSAIGVLVGLGFYIAAIALTILSAGLMMWGSRLEAWLPSRPAIAVEVRLKCGCALDEAVLVKLAHERGYDVALGSLSVSYRDGQPEWRFVAVAHDRKSGASFTQLARELPHLEGVESFRLFPARN